MWKNKYERESASVYLGFKVFAFVLMVFVMGMIVACDNTPRGSVRNEKETTPPPLVTYTKDTLLMAATVVCECRGEGKWAKACARMTLNIIVNRSNQLGLPFEDVILAESQFSCYNKRDVNQKEMLLSTIDGVTSLPENLDPFYKYALYASQKAVQGELRDNTGGSTHYITKAVYESPRRPKWVSEMKIVKQVGSHVVLKTQ